MSETTESRIIAQLLGTPLSPNRQATVPGDDAVVVAGGTLVSVDTMVEGIHFDHRLSPEDVGWKLVAVNASDLAACGRHPAWALLSVSLPAADMDWVRAFSTGLHAALNKWNITLSGGDTTGSPGVRVVSLTVGSESTGALVTRTGAMQGDDVWVSGALGRAGAGFLHATPEGLSWLRRPCPPVALGVSLAEHRLVHAMMDLSDGLHADLRRLCAASGVGASIFLQQLPRDGALSGLSSADIPGLLTSFGEDYQLLFTAAASPERRGDIRAVAQELGVRVTRVGQCTPAHQGVLLDGGDWPAPHFSHFSPKP